MPRAGGIFSSKLPGSALAKKAQTQVGHKAIQAVWADAKRAVEGDQLPADPDPNLPRGGFKPGAWPGYPSDNMPPPETLCKVQVVGRDAEGTVYVITSTGHLRRIDKWDHAALVDIFAPMSNTLKFCWPAWGKAIEVTDPETGEVKKIVPVKRAERDSAMECLINEAARKPDFDPNQQHRGRGGWQDANGAFIWHSGGWLWQAVNGRLDRSRPAMHAGYLYTRQKATIEPWQSPVSAEESPAQRILQDLRTWNWQRPYLDPILVLGWIATALMGGALAYRPIVFASGGAGVGKSRLQEVVKSALEGAVITSVNTTAAGIYQRVKQDALPFMVDELESKAGSSRAESVIELARVAYSGGDISRGGADHEATTFTARNSFFFSAIIPPPMGAQDKTRMALLNLGPLERAGHAGRDITLAPETDGRMMLRQIMDGWQDFRDRIMPNYAASLGEQGLSARAIDTFGTLLAAAELLVGTAALEEVGLPVTEHVRVGEMIAAATASERTENLPHWHQCIDILLQSTIEQWREGIKPTVGSVCDDVANNGMDVAFARERLQLVGLGIHGKGKLPDRPELGACLAVPVDTPQLRRIYADTDFHKGGWHQALKQAPVAIVVGARKVKINGSTKHCMLVDLEAFDRHAAGTEKGG